MTFKYDPLVYFALCFVLIGFILCGVIVLRANDKPDLETRKLRFAAATFAGIMMLFVFVSTLYFAGEVGTAPGSNPGKDIFEKGLTAMFTLAGTIVGYLFGSSKPREKKEPLQPPNVKPD